MFMLSRIMPAILFAASIPVWAQTSTGDILGTISDASGAAVVDAKVTIKNLETNATRMHLALHPKPGELGRNDGLEARREPGVVARGHRGGFVALQSDVAHARRGDEFEDGLEHAESGAQHRHDHDVRCQHTSVSRSKRRLHGRGRDGHPAEGLGGKENADTMRGPAKRRRARRGISKLGERVVRERMIDDVK